MVASHRILIVGVGSIGERHVRCFQATGRGEVSFVEVNNNLREAIAERYGIRSVHANLAGALAGRADVAVIATPASLHVPQATQLVEAGVHVLIEKPLSTSLDGVDRLLELVRARRAVAGVAYVYRLHPALAAMKEALAAQRFGRPLQLTALSGQHFPTYRPAYRDIYYADHAQGGGAIQDALTHLVNTGEWLVGPVDRLVVDAAHQALEGVVVEDTVHLLTRHGAVLGCYGLNQHQAANETTITVICERGTARFEFHENRWRWMVQPGGEWHDEPISSLERETLFILQAHRFLDAVEGKEDVSCSLLDGLQTLRVSLAALESLEKHSWQTICGTERTMNSPISRPSSFIAV